MPRKLSAWLLITALSLASLSPLQTRAASCGRQSCCSSGSCCRMGHCSMPDPGDTSGDAAGKPARPQMGHCLMRGARASTRRTGMPTNCSMGQPSTNTRCSVSCRCSISPSPSVAAAPIHGYLYFDPSEPGVVSRLATAGWLSSFPALSTQAGFPQRAEHPPKLHS
jgi:hypothetical protein